MKKILGILLFTMSLNILANETTAKKIEEAIEKIAEIEREVNYDRVIVKDSPGTERVGTKENLFVTFNVDYDAKDDYVVHSELKPNTAKVVNNAKLSSYAEVFTSKHGHVFTNLIHFTNNGNIEGTADNVNALTLYAPYVYYKGERGSRLYGEIYKPLDIEASKFSVVDNAGEIIKGTLILGKENNLINREHGSIDKVGIAVEENIRLKNEGKITENISLSAKESIDFENSGKITGRLSISKNNLTYQPYYGYEKKRILKTKFINNENGLLEFLNSRFSFEISSTELDFVNKGRIFYSKDAIIKKEDLKDEVMSRYQKSLGKINIKHYLGRFVNENIIDGSIRFEEKIDNNAIDIKPFEIHLEDGILNGGIDIDSDETISGGKYKGNEIIVSINEVRDISEKIDASNRFNETLKLLGKDELLDSNKFIGFEKIHLKDADWKFKGLNIEASNEILIENSILTLDGGKLKTSILNNESNSMIKISEETTIDGNLTNKGTILFENDPVAHNNLNITGNYIGENGKISLRVKVEEEPEIGDRLIIAGEASGNTNIEVSNPGSTLNQRMRKKIKIIETNTSTEDAFTLLNPNHGAYSYKLISLQEGSNKNWYLKQNFENPTDDLGIVINSMILGQHEFNFDFLDHSKNNLELSKDFWVKTSNMTSYNKLSDRNTIEIPVKSNTTTTIVGYDVLRKVKNQNSSTFGVFGNLGFDTSVSGKEKISSITGLFGAGIYGTWKNGNFYADGWLNYTYLQNRINTEMPINYGLHSLKASAEVGVNKTLNIGSSLRLKTQHHWQLIYSYITKPKILEAEGVEYIGNQNLRSKLGTNLTLYTNNKYIKPFIEFNWNYDVNLVGIKLGEEIYYYDGNKNMMNIKWGLKEIDINDNLSLWTNISHQFGERKYRNHGVELGMSYKF